MDSKNKIQRTLTTKSETGTKVYTVNAAKSVKINAQDNKKKSLYVISDNNNSEDGLILHRSVGHIKSGSCYEIEGLTPCYLTYYRSPVNNDEWVSSVINTIRDNNNDINVWHTRYFASDNKYGQEIEFGSMNDNILDFKINGPLTSSGIQSNGNIQVNGDINFTGQLLQNGSAFSSGGGGGSSTNQFNNVMIGTNITNNSMLNIEANSNASFPYVRIKANSSNHIQTGMVLDHINDSNRYVKFITADHSAWSWNNLFAIRFCNTESTQRNILQAYEYASYIDTNIGASNNINHLTVYGDIDYTGIITDISDGRFKKNQKEVDYKNCYEKIKQIKLKTYDWDIEKIQSYNEEKIVLERPTNELGFIAQELEEIIPDSVKEKEKYNIKDFKSVEYNKINLYLFGAVKELMKENEQIKKELQMLKNKFIDYILK